MSEENGAACGYALACQCFQFAAVTNYAFICVYGGAVTEKKLPAAVSHYHVRCLAYAPAAAAQRFVLWV